MKQEKMVKLQVWVLPHQKEYVQKLAKKQKDTESEIGRFILQGFIDSRKNNLCPKN